jgi:redox-sensitive bicupin YhaK (pirin superfamily)
MKTIKTIIPAQKVNMGGHYLDQPLPSRELDYIDPFLLIHHWDSTLKGGQKQSEVGVGPHPHRGFSPVTFVFKGNVEHRDSLGKSAIVSEGGTQWMFAGRGITHSERQGKDLAENGGEVEFIQFWVNAPAKNKMDTPYYQPINNEDTPKIIEDGVEIGVVAGEFNGIKGAAPTLSAQILLRGMLDKNAAYTFPIPREYNALLYLLDGELEINKTTVVKRRDMVVFNNDSDEFEMKANEDTRFILLSGEPLNEKVVSHGPFVMNNESEIMQAFSDAQKGKMGILIEDF